MAITHAVYEPPFGSLPYLVVAFLPNGKLEVTPFTNARKADAYAAREWKSALRKQVPAKKSGKPAQQKRRK